MHPLFDSHAHYDDHRFAEEFEGGVDGAIRAAHDAGVTYIANEKGTILPETGGMGTKIFYGIGGMMMLVAVVLLVTRKRMSK